MANFVAEEEEVNENLEDTLQEGEELSNSDTEDSTDIVENSTEEEGDDVDGNTIEDSIPDKYKGKSIAEIVQMHQEAEKAIGRQGSEVGELRKIVDDFVKANLDNGNAHNKQETETSVDIWDDPDAYVESKLKNNPDLKEVREIKEELRRQSVLNKLNTEYPDWQDTVNNDSNFADWIRKSESRIAKFQRASNEYSWEDADDLLSTWGEIKKAMGNAKETAKAEVKEQRKAASTGSASGSGESKSRKIYRRADIINLMQKDPARYQQLSDEIMKAYQEGRVR